MPTPHKETAPDRERVRAPRFEPRNAVQLNVKTIGTQISYPLVVKDLSRTGCLVYWAQKRCIPFLEGTIVEMHATYQDETGGCHLEIKCLGKVARFFKGPEGAKYFGLRIIQMDETTFDQWDQMLLTLAEGAREIPVNDPHIREQQLRLFPLEMQKLCAIA